MHATPESSTSTSDAVFRKASLAMLIIAVFPAIMMGLAVATGMPSLRPLLYGGGAWLGVLLVLAWGVRSGALWAGGVLLALSTLVLGGMSAVALFRGEIRGAVIFALMSIAATRGAWRLLETMRATNRSPATVS